MSLKEYALRFTQLLKYAPSIVADPRDKMSIFVSGVPYMVVKEYRTTMLVHGHFSSYWCMHNRLKS